MSWKENKGSQLYMLKKYLHSGTYPYTLRYFALEFIWLNPLAADDLFNVKICLFFLVHRDSLISIVLAKRDMKSCKSIQNNEKFHKESMMTQC